MATVRIDRGMNRGPWGGLPQLCVRCGGPALMTKDKTFAWFPGWVYILLALGPFLGLLPFFIGALATLQRARLRVPVCKRHLKHWFWPALVLWGGLMAVILLAIAVAVFAVVATEGANNPARDSLGYVCVAAVVVPLLWLVSAAIMQASAIRATEIREDSVVLTGVAKSFRERAMEMRDRRYSEVVSETNGGQTMASEFQWTQPAADTKLCPYCAETINATAIKCRFCGEFLEDE